MNAKQEDILNMYINRIVWYSTYVDCLSRVLYEFIENSDDNLKAGDLANISELQTKFAYRLKQLCSSAGSIVEFGK